MALATPHISVIIPTAGRPSLLAETLASLRACSPAPDEVIVIDGDQRESARPVVRRLERGAFEPRLRYLRSRRSSTLQRNRGIAAASGEILVFADDDVTFEPEAFSRLAGAFADRAVVGATGRVIETTGNRVGGQCSAPRRWLPGGGREGTFTRFGYPRYLTHLEQPRDVEFMAGCFMSARREAGARVRFDERMTGYALGEDEDFSYRLSRLGRLRYVPAAVVHHRKAGFGSMDRRAFSRLAVVNRAYLFRKNFPRTGLARGQFGLFVALLLAHRILNRDMPGARGVIEGAAAAWRDRG